MKHHFKAQLWILLIVLLMQSGGLWLGIKTLQTLHIAQQELRIHASPIDAVALFISKAEFEAYSIEDGKELCIRGRMFDVISIRASNDSVYVKVLEDRFEAKLIAMLTQGNATSESLPQSDAFLLALMHLHFIAPAENALPFIREFHLHSKLPHFSQLNWKAPKLKNIKQPPEYTG